MIPIFEKAWALVEQDYVSNLINSERCLQASMYRHLMNQRGVHQVLVEPKEPPACPDLMLCGDTSVQAFVEVRFAPHRSVPRSNLSKSIGNLLENALFLGADIRLGHFGPTGEKGGQAGSTDASMRRLEVDTSTLFVLCVISQHDDTASSLQGLVAEYSALKSVGNFVLLSLATHPERGANRLTTRSVTVLPLTGHLYQARVVLASINAAFSAEPGRESGDMGPRDRRIRRKAAGLYHEAMMAKIRKDHEALEMALYDLVDLEPRM